MLGTIFHAVLWVIPGNVSQDTIFDGDTQCLQVKQNCFDWYIVAWELAL